MEYLNEGPEYDRAVKLATRRILGYGADPASIRFGKLRVIYGPARSYRDVELEEIWAEYTCPGHGTSRWTSRWERL